MKTKNPLMAITSIVQRNSDPLEHQVQMTIGVQTFDVGYIGSKEEVEWMQKMLNKALANLGVSVESSQE